MKPYSKVEFDTARITRVECNGVEFDCNSEDVLIKILYLSIFMKPETCHHFPRIINSTQATSIPLITSLLSYTSNLCFFIFCPLDCAILLAIYHA